MPPAEAHEDQKHDGDFLWCHQLQGRGVFMEFHLPKFTAWKGGRAQGIILNLGIQPGLKNHFHQVATPTRGKAAAYQPTTIWLTLWRRVNCSNQRTTQLPSLHLESRLAKKKKTQNPDKFSRTNTQDFGSNTSWQHLGGYRKVQVNLINASQQQREQPGSAASPISSCPKALAMSSLTTASTEGHRHLLRLSQGALMSLELDISSGLPSDRQH